MPTLCKLFSWSGIKVTPFSHLACKCSSINLKPLPIYPFDTTSLICVNYFWYDIISHKRFVVNVEITLKRYIILPFSYHVSLILYNTRWRHQMETFSALLAICAGNLPVAGGFPTQRPMTRSFDVFFDLHPNKRLSKQWSGWWFETLSRPLWRHRNGLNTARLWENNFEVVSWTHQYICHHLIAFTKLHLIVNPTEFEHGL